MPALAWRLPSLRRKAQEVRAVHQEPGEALLNRHAKQARHDLNEARKRLQHFSLDFLSEKWSELEKPGSFRKYLSSLWRADEMSMASASGDATQLIWRDYKFKTGLGLNDFSVSALKR